MNPISSGRTPGADRGFALAGMIVALATAGLFVAGLFFLAVAEMRQGLGSMDLARAEAAASLGASAAVSLLRPDSSAQAGAVDVNPGVRYEYTTASLGYSYSLLRVDGTQGRGFARRRIYRLVRFRVPELPRIKAVLTATGVISGEPRVSAATGPSVAPCAVAPDISTILLARPDGCPECATAGISPAIDTALLAISPDRLAGLRSLSDYVLDGGRRVFIPSPSVDSDRGCDREDPRNWGEVGSRGPCASFYPIVFVEGDLRVVEGSGQGILVVDGDLVLSGGFEYDGAVIVTGMLSFASFAGRIRGSVTTGSVSFPQNSGFSRPFVVFSTCAVEAALAAHRIPVPLSERSWLDLN